MKKRILFSILIAIATLSCNSTFAKTKAPENTTEKQTNQKVVQKENPEIKEIKDILVQLDEANNEKDIKLLKSLFAENYKNFDGLSKEHMFKLIEKTWKDFPDMKFSSKLKEVIINNESAYAQTTDYIKGTTVDKSSLTDDTGNLISISENITYFQKIGKNWKIISDKILFEKTFLKYGTAKDINVDFSAPFQVKSGDKYTASIYVKVPPNSLALGSIANEPIVYPEIKSEEKFRQIPSDSGVLERIIKSNTTNNNELAVGSIGFSQLVHDKYQKPQIKLTGIILMMQRVNVLSESILKNKEEPEKEIKIVEKKTK